MRLKWLVGVISTTLSLSTRSGACLQAPVVHPGLAALRAAVEQEDTVAALDHDVHVGAIRDDAEAVDALRRAFLALAAGRRSGDQRAVEGSLGVFERVAVARPEWTEVWLGLGEARGALLAMHAPAKEGELQPLGVGYLEGMQAALVRSLELDSTYLAPLRRLLSSPATTSQARRRASLAAIRRAPWGDVVDPQLLLDRARWEATVGAPDSAIAVLSAFLRAGGDTAIGYFHLARELFRTGEVDRGVRTYLAGARHATTSLAWALFGADVAWVASPQELLAWKAEPGASRAEWIIRFWARRDVEGGLPSGGRLAEHYRRLEFALKHYGRDSLSVNRSVPGKGAAGDATSTSSDLSGESADGDIGQGTPGWQGNWDGVVGGESPFLEYHSGQAAVDDRGIIYVRHGPPDQVAFFVGGPGTPANVSWRYSRGDSSVIYHFMEVDNAGKVGPSVLVAALPRYMLESRCGLDSRLCLLAMRRTVPPEMVAHERERGREAIAWGTSTDEFQRQFSRAIDAHAQVLGLFSENPASADQRIVVPWAISGEKLTGERGPDGVLYRIRVQLTAYDSTSGRRIDLDTLRTLRAPRALHSGEFLTGVSELTAPPGAYLVAVSVSEGEAGSRLLASSARVPERGDELALADIVVGKVGGGPDLRLGGLVVPTNPLGVFTKGDTLDLTYALVGLRAGQQYDVSLSLAPSDHPTKPSVSLKVVEVAEGKEGVYHRRMGLRDVKRGRYLLQVDVRCRGCTGAVSRVSEVSISDK